jgi:pimeloyl-ACP methyl ester carboxylesterase
MILAAALAAQLTLTMSPCHLDGVPGDVKCGTHSVREDPNARGGSTRMLGVSVIVLSALDADKAPDPFFMLAGGPGDAPSFNARFFSRIFSDIRRKRDIVLVDLRGTGRSSALLCPELAQPASDGIFDARVRGTVSPAHRQPTQSAIPTLLLSGEFDPVTPPSGGKEVARGLANGRHIVILNNGHPIGNAEACVGRMIGQLLDSGSVAGIDQRCATDSPAVPFVVPGKQQ